MKSVNLFLPNKTQSKKIICKRSCHSIRQKCRTICRFSYKKCEYFLYGGQTDPQNKCFDISLGLVFNFKSLNNSAHGGKDRVLAQYIRFGCTTCLDCTSHILTWLSKRCVFCCHGCDVILANVEMSVPHQNYRVGSRFWSVAIAVTPPLPPPPSQF